MFNISPYFALFLLVITFDVFAGIDKKHDDNINLTLGNGEGQPGEHYWQQKLTYKITAHLQPSKKYLQASAEVTYYNNSPDSLTKLWFELPQQRFKAQSKSIKFNKPALTKHDSVVAGTNYLKVFDKSGKPLKVHWHDTFFFIEPTNEIKAHSQRKFTFEWDLTLVNRTHTMRPRSGYEVFEKDKMLLGLAQWFPRAVAYTSAIKWSLTPFLGEAEFSLELADYQVTLSLPSDYLVMATGQLQNPEAVLSTSQYDKWLNLAEEPVFITETTASTPASTKQDSKLNDKIWYFSANNVRDFSFATGNNLLWQSQKLVIKGKPIRLNVVFPDNGRWLWAHYALAATRHSVQYLSNTLGEFPFETLSIVNLSGISMEYPGIKFVGFRGPDHNINAKQAVYSRTEKYDVIGGIIHEVAHSYFPMQVNTDERLQGFFDEGLTSYLSYLVEQAWNPNFQSFYGKPFRVFEASKKDNYSPPYQFADEVSNKLDSHYHVPAVAFNVLNQSLLDDNQFHQVLVDFITTWQGKRAYFKDFTNFVTSQAGKDLKWFWYHWFETNKHVDMAIDHIELVPSNKNSLSAVDFGDDDTNNITLAQINVIDPSREKPLGTSFEGINPDKQDQYSYTSDDNELSTFNWETCLFEQKDKRKLAKQELQTGIRLQLSNLGGIPAPIVVKVILNDGTSLLKTWPEKLWLLHSNPIKLVWNFEREVNIRCIVLDAERMTGDVDRENNLYIVK